MESLFTKHYTFPFSKSLEKITGSFGITAKILFAALVVTFIGSALFLLYSVSGLFMVEIPRKGGTLREGVVGLPQFINPILTVSGPSQDLTELIYSGLLKKNPDGTFVPDIADSYTVSPDGKTYTFILRDDLTFHDGKPITTDDVEFTILRAVEPSLKSPKRVNWEGVTIQKVSPTSIQFVLKQPYPFFLENATLGILPKHIWKDVALDEFTFSNYNRNPIGSGPYRLQKIRTDSGGIPRSYELEAFKNYAGGEPYLSHISMSFYGNEEKLVEAYQSGTIDTLSSLSPEDALILEKGGATIDRTVLPRIFGVFFNTNKNPALGYKEARQALSLSVNKEALVQNILQGYGIAIDSPLPVHFEDQLEATHATGTITGIEAAQALLESKDWERNADNIYEKKTSKETVELSITISTSDVPELRAMAEAVKADWESLGARVTLKIFETSDLNQNIIRPRNFEALLFGQVVSRDTDLYAFWHSSERNDPGLNITMYANSTVDKLLDEARGLSELSERLTRYEKVVKEIQTDAPAIFLYSPEFLYVIPKNLQGMAETTISDPKDRYAGIESWYLETDGVWKIFAPKTI